MKGIIRCNKWIVCLFLLVSAILLLSGCRSRISDSPDVTETVSMQGAPQAVQQYEEMRETLQLEQPVTPLKEQLQKASPAASDPKTTTAQGKSSGNGQGKSKGPGSGKGSGGTGNKGSGKGTDNGKTETEGIQVKLDPNGGSCEVRTMKVTPGRKYGTLPAAVRDGYLFRGWFTAPDGGLAITANSKVTANKKHTLYAHWEKAGDDAEYTLTFDANGGRITKKYATKVLRKGDPYGPFPNVYNDGYELEGWFTEPEGGEQIAEDTAFPGGEDQVIFAHWQYDPYTYWSYQLRNTTERMYSCQVVGCYIEFEDHVTASSCPLLRDCKAENVAMNRGDDIVVTDEWVEGRNPAILIKCTNADPGSASAALQQRLPGKRILVVPEAAVSGSPNEQLFYTLNLGTLVYPSWFDGIDLGQAASDLGVSGGIYE